MKNCLKSLTKSLRFISDFSAYFYKGWKAALLKAYIISFVRSSIFHLKQFPVCLYSKGIQCHYFREDKIKKLQKSASELYSLLPYDSRFSYSILLPVAQPHPSLFRESIESVLNQGIASLELLIALTYPCSKQVEEILEDLQGDYPSKIQVFYFSRYQGKEERVNQLAEKSSGHFLLIMGEEDWMRPDFFFRFEQTLRLFSNPEQRVLYCNLNALNAKGYFIPNSEYCQPSQFSFPFFFKSFIPQGLLIPTLLWKKSGGLQKKFKGAEYNHLLLQLHQAGAIFQHIPLSLYSLRATTKREEYPSQQAFLEVLRNDSKMVELHWEWLPGYEKSTVRAIPLLPLEARIQVIIPYKDEKELTMKCIQSVLKQQHVQVQITAVDNGSKDGSIAEAIVAQGGEVIVVNEPFNYSRLNNLAVKQTTLARECDVLLFLNNDIQLKLDAMSEMLRWIHQPQIGIVGCRLHYPDGRLQHGGVQMHPHGKEEMRWEHVEKFRRFDEMHITKTLGIFDAVTAACAMMKRQTFLEVGGFDEIWYPIGYSDTNLAAKIAAKGLFCFYTPYAVGIHHESISRKTSIEDYEKSCWLHDLWMDRWKKNNEALASVLGSQKEC